MKIVDLSHLMNVHTPGWVGYAGNQMYYAQNLQTKMIVAQRIDTALHVGTHIDGAMHGTDGMGDMASYPLDFLVGAGAVVDVSRHMDDWAVITPEMIEAAPVEVREGDILIIHTGWHRYWEGQPRQDLVRYFCMHPGGKIELLEWMLKKRIKWFGIDCGSAAAGRTWHAGHAHRARARPDRAGAGICLALRAYRSHHAAAGPGSRPLAGPSDVRPAPAGGHRAAVHRAPAARLRFRQCRHERGRPR